MNSATFYASKYGGTGEYAGWIAEATGLPGYDIDAPDADPADFEFLVPGSAVIYYKLIFSNWVLRHRDAILTRPTLPFTVSGAPAGKKRGGWIADCLPSALVHHIHHVALRGRQIPQVLTWFDRFMLTVAGLKNRDRQAGREEIRGFDDMDCDSVLPVVDLIKKRQAANGLDVASHAAELLDDVSALAERERLQ